MENGPGPSGTKETDSFEWKPEYDSVLEHIAFTDIVDIEWTRLRNIIKYKIDTNIRRYLADDVEKEEKKEKNEPETPNKLPRSSPMSLASSSPSNLTPSPANSGHQGDLVRPPFPRRERRGINPMRIFNSVMDEKEATETKEQIFEQLEEFESNPPFTVQRLCELCIQPRQHYKTVGKYLRALERTTLVTSTQDMYPPEIGDGDAVMSAPYGDNESLRQIMTPVFSPIPFLHDDARRSRSPSPFELAATKHPSSSTNDSERIIGSSRPHQGLGLVDELDDPKPGHLADHPKALTSASTTGSASGTRSLSERFVKSSNSELENGRDASETADSRQAEDAEVEEMVLDDNILEDEDKENRPS